VDSFWFGVDFPGDTLTQVIITRLPFPHPQDPLQIARRSILPEREYWQRYRYETAIKLRQGIGRLIRSEADSGQVVILDARYRKYYGNR
jgi:ATP-dependent DNA helicase DinG